MANVTSPFPHQVFNEADLAILRTQIAQQKSRFSELQCKLQSSMEQFWTEARLKRFCRPENVYVPFSAALKLGFNSELFMSGNLFPNRPELGKIRWYVTFWDGEPDYYQLDVWKDSSYWRISSHVPDLNRTGDKGLLDQSKRSISE